MPSLSQIRQSNNLLREGPPGLVAVVAGATSGIGEATCREFVRVTESPRVYLVGRNSTKGSSIVRDLQQLNPSATVFFIQADLTILRNADQVLKIVSEKEKKVNLLFLSQGFLSLKGRQGKYANHRGYQTTTTNASTETSEGLDMMISLQYFSRIRLINNFLPLLHQAAGTELARVVSVLGAGNETEIVTDDIEVTNNYSLQVASNQSITMTSLAMDELARSHPDISFLHVYPGVVRGTGITQGLGRGIATVGRLVMSTLARPFTVSLSESGERHVYAATSSAFAPRGESGLVEGSVRRLAWNGEPCGPSAILTRYKSDGTQGRVMEMTETVIRRVVG